MRKTTGFSLMLLIFLSLSLVIFSLLSLSGATADEKLSLEAAGRTTEYYEAATKAEKMLAKADEQLAASYLSAQTSSDPESTYLRLCSRIPEILDGITWDAQAKTLSFTISIRSTQHLYAEILPVFPEAGQDSFYEIVSWQIVNSLEWNPDRSQNLYQMEE